MGETDVSVTRCLLGLELPQLELDAIAPSLPESGLCEHSVRDQQQRLVR